MAIALAELWLDGRQTQASGHSARAHTAHASAGTDVSARQSPSGNDDSDLGWDRVFVGLGLDGDTQAAPTARAAGEFRGDWGEQPVYGLNDSVRYRQVVYQSLIDANQNLPPDEHPQAWQPTERQAGPDPFACAHPELLRDMSQCDFSTADHLKDLNLQGAILRNARLAGELGQANLRGADLSGSAVIGSLTLSPQTQAAGANFSKLQTGGNNPLIAAGADLNHADFSDANLYGAQLNQADLSAAKLNGATLSGAQMAESNLQGAQLANGKLAYANLTGASLAGAELNAADLSSAYLADTDFNGADLQNADLAGADLAGSDFSGADLHGANLADAQNTEHAVIDAATDFTAAVCPDGVTVDGVQVTTCIGHGF
ncbi:MULTISPECIES: pentapeptide repeat-containing protein [Methylomonas]|uniref:pentapeptide repeat-containing protein n=1 Tax=Methylomonas TaxID=416 RepID=UPI001681AB88|nr:pentapeptide repeat-containing protein [Methylomonas rhizoryzae]